MAKPGRVQTRVEDSKIVLDFRGLSRGLQTRVADILASLPEMFGEIRQKGRVIVARILGSEGGAQRALLEAFEQRRVKLSLEMV